MVEGRIIPPHKSKGIEGCSRYSPGPGKARRKVHLSVDNTVAYSYLKKQGGRKQAFNSILKPLLEHCTKKDITLLPNLVASRDCLADSISRWPQDRGDYQLNTLIFSEVRKIFQGYLDPKVDMFASPGNKQLPLWVGRFPHHGALGCNALEMPLDLPEMQGGVYANPPWSIISQWLQRLRANPSLECLVAVPLWAGCTWWPLLTKLQNKQCPVLAIAPRWGLFTSCLGEKMPPTRWHLLCLVLSGKCYRQNKFQLKISHYI